MVKIYNDNDIEELAAILKNNGVICVPTDTVYGLCTPINSKIGYEKLIKIKNRPQNKLFPIMCSDIEQIKDICIINEREEKIINSFMPGPITLILKKKEDYNHLNYPTIAVRMATSKALKELIELVGCPLYMTSANHSNERPYNNIEEIKDNLKELDGILSGSVKFDMASTIVDCTNIDIKILRDGPIAINEIENIIK